MKRSSTQLTTQSVGRSPSFQSYASKRSRTSSVTKRGKTVRTGLLKNPGFGFPPRYQTKLRYVTNFTISSTTTPGRYQFRCNGLFDPDITNTGHQPLYFDQLMALYDHFTVVKATLKLTISPSTSAITQFSVFQNDDSSVAPTLMSDSMEQSSAKNVLIQPNTGPQVIYLTFDAYKTFGGSVLGNPNLQGSSAADPAEQAVWTLSAQSVDLVASAGVAGVAEIIYDTVFDEVRDIASS